MNKKLYILETFNECDSYYGGCYISCENKVYSHDAMKKKEEELLSSLVKKTEEEAEKLEKALLSFDRTRELLSSGVYITKEEYPEEYECCENIFGMAAYENVNLDMSKSYNGVGFAKKEYTEEKIKKLREKKTLKDFKYSWKEVEYIE